MQSAMDRSCHRLRLTSTFDGRPDPLRLEPVEHFGLSEANDAPELEAGEPASLDQSSTVDVESARRSASSAAVRRRSLTLPPEATARLPPLHVARGAHARLASRSPRRTSSRGRTSGSTGCDPADGRRRRRRRPRRRCREACAVSGYQLTGLRIPVVASKAALTDQPARVLAPPSPCAGRRAPSTTRSSTTRRIVVAGNPVLSWSSARVSSSPPDARAGGSQPTAQQAPNPSRPSARAATPPSRRRRSSSRAAISCAICFARRVGASGSGR